MEPWAHVCTPRVPIDPRLSARLPEGQPIVAVALILAPDELERVVAVGLLDVVAQRVGLREGASELGLIRRGLPVLPVARVVPRVQGDVLARHHQAVDARVVATDAVVGPVVELHQATDEPLQEVLVLEEEVDPRELGQNAPLAGAPAAVAGLHLHDDLGVVPPEAVGAVVVLVAENGRVVRARHRQALLLADEDLDALVRPGQLHGHDAVALGRVVELDPPRDAGAGGERGDFGHDALLRPAQAPVSRYGITPAPRRVVTLTVFSRIRGAGAWYVVWGQSTSHNLVSGDSG